MAAAASASILDATADTRLSPYVRAALEANIVHLKGRVRELADDVEDLRTSKTRVTKETHEFVQYATEQLKQKDDIIKELGARLREVDYVKDAEIRRLKQQMESTLDIALSEQRATEADLRERLRQADAKLERAQSYLEMREKFETEIAALQRELAEQKQAYDAALAELERKYLIDKAALAKAQEAKIMELRRQAREEAQRSLDADTTRVIIENQRMGEELALNAEETKVLGKERLAMSEQARMLAREVELYADKEKEWARQGVRRTQENRALRTRVEELEAELGKEREARTSERQELAKIFEKQTEDLRLDVEGLTSLLALRTRELRTVKKLAGIILQQRTDVEQFFLDALAEVKQQVAKRKAEAALSSLEQSKTRLERSGIHAAFLPAKQARGSLRSTTAAAGASIALRVPPSTAQQLPRMSFGQLAKDATLASPSPTSSQSLEGRVDDRASVNWQSVALSDLTPDDRERVLKALFARIHSAEGRISRKGSHNASVVVGEDGAPPSARGTSAVNGPFGLSAEIPDSLTQLEVAHAAIRVVEPPAAGPTAPHEGHLGDDVDTAALAQRMVSTIRDRGTLEDDLSRASSRHDASELGAT